MSNQPTQLWEQYEGKCFAELVRGSGWWPLQSDPIDLEPPWQPYVATDLSIWDAFVNQWTSGVHGGPQILGSDETILIEPAAHRLDTLHDLHIIRIRQFPEDSSTIAMADQLLSSLQTLQRPIAFEIEACGGLPDYDVGRLKEIYQVYRERGDTVDTTSAITGYTPAYTQVQFAVRDVDLALVQQQLNMHYPNSAITPMQPDIPFEFDYLFSTGEKWCAALCLDRPYTTPLRQYTRLDPDPLLVAVAACEELHHEEWAVLHILFQPCTAPWATTVQDALDNPYLPGQHIIDIQPDELKQLKQKFSSPLFAVSVILMSNSFSCFKHLYSWASQFDAGQVQRLLINKAYWHDNAPNEFERYQLEYSVQYRCAYRPGMILNQAELASLMHVPAAGIRSGRLQTVTMRTRPAADTPDERGSIVIGTNEHRGTTKRARIPAGLRMRHCYIAGQTGTGKTTLLLNMLLQDIAAGHGVCLLDPHGDMTNAALRHIPPHRVNDVILFDPSDDAFPLGLNILEARDTTERPRVISELLMSFEKHFSSWGPRLERTLHMALSSMLDVLPHPTLLDVERMLTNQSYRKSVTDRITNERHRSFWETWKFNSQSVDPVLNKLSPFLEHPTVRNIICQRESKIDFDRLLNHRGILLCNLSSGLLTEKVANVLGSFLVTKIVNSAFRRARIPEEDRIPFFLYVDEFQAFVNTSVGFEKILSESRKYRLSLTLANQFLGQLDDRVRQAVFGNVGVMCFFRVGTSDAGIAARELGPFEPEELLNLGLGEAFVRVETSKQSFNIATDPPPSVPAYDPTYDIIIGCREKYARPKEDVELEILKAATHRPESVDLPPDPDDERNPASRETLLPFGKKSLLEIELESDVADQLNNLVALLEFLLKKHDPMFEKEPGTPPGVQDRIMQFWQESGLPDLGSVLNAVKYRNVVQHEDDGSEPAGQAAVSALFDAVNTVLEHGHLPNELIRAVKSKRHRQRQRENKKKGKRQKGQSPTDDQSPPSPPRDPDEDDLLPGN